MSRVLLGLELILRTTYEYVKRSPTTYFSTSAKNDDVMDDDGDNYSNALQFDPFIP